MRVGQVGYTVSTEMIHVWRERGVLSTQRIAVAIDEIITYFTERTEKILTSRHCENMPPSQKASVTGGNPSGRSKRGPLAVNENLFKSNPLKGTIVFIQSLRSQFGCLSAPLKPGAHQLRLRSVAESPIAIGTVTSVLRQRHPNQKH